MSYVVAVEQYLVFVDIIAAISRARAGTVGPTKCFIAIFCKLLF